MRTFAGIQDDAVHALQRGSALVVTPGRRSDVVTVSMESPYPEEARQIVDAIVRAYLDERVEQRTAVARDVGTLIDRERATLEERRKVCQDQLAVATRESGVASLAEPGGNTSIKRSATLADAVTQAELRQSDLQARRDAAAGLLDSPQRRTDYIHSLQSRGTDSGDANYKALCQQLMSLETNLAVLTTSFGEKHPKVIATLRATEDLRQRVADYEVGIARSNLEALSTEASSAKQTLDSLVALESRQQTVTQSMGTASSRYAQLTAELDRINRQAELLEQRATANRIDNVVARSLEARVLEPAVAGQGPVLPQKGMTLAVALMAGAIVGGGLALARETFDGRLRSVEDIQPIYGTRVLARVPRITNNTSPLARAMIVRLDPRGAGAEAYRTLRIMLHLGMTKKSKTVLVASAAGGDGKSTTASNLAIAFAEAGERTLLIDADLRGPVQHMIFELDPSNGLSRVLAGETKLTAALRPSGIDRLDVLPCGPIPGCPSEMLGSERFLHVMETLSAAYDRIVIDSPPLGHTPDAAVLAAVSDATILVVRLHASTIRLADLAVGTLRNVGANLVGVVANDVASGLPGSYLDGSWRYSAYARRFALEPTTPAAALAALAAPPHATNGTNGSNGSANGTNGASGVPHAANGTDRFDQITVDRATDGHARTFSR